ncbi:MAG: KamA family radical SAM protein [Chlamydiota bacterium]
MPVWKDLLKTNITSWKALSQYLEWTSVDKEQLVEKPSFRLNIPRRLARKMGKNTLEDPLLLQFIPLQTKKSSLPISSDPLQEFRFQKCPRILHKYRGRALFVTTSACAMHCQYCFRQNFPYEKDKASLEAAFGYIEKTTSLREIILSGGDPLSLDDPMLDYILTRLSSIPHINKLRFHTRFPVGIPERITPSFLTLLRKTAPQIVFVLHINHPKEWDDDLATSLRSIQRLGIPVLTQTVLLRKVNDSARTLQDLFTKVSDQGILPYYLHQLDLVKGSEFLHVPKEEGLLIMEELRNALPGYAVPRYAQEIPGKQAKTLLF